MINRAKTPASRRRRASIAVELLLLTPIVLGLIVGVVELSMMTAANEHLSAASREGARVAAIGGDANQITQAVYNNLGNGSLSQANIIAVFTQDQNGNPIPSVLTINGSSDPNTNMNNSNPNTNANNITPILSGNPVMVRVEIAANQAVPDLLAFIGFSLSQSTLVGQTIVRKE